jgi:hypothetical protein
MKIWLAVPAAVICACLLAILVWHFAAMLPAGFSIQ